ncbi:hypothetical protein BKA70DRAFT_1524540 [Coprinopsis sp. MPI-PUGE-AT-0042]|nr:hypothetical protein BKA70DRAFT_1524540 [Coprinopsis sp. MPI-PUGE-AT-0042]
MRLSYVLLTAAIQTCASFGMEFKYRDNDVFVPYKGGGGWSVAGGVFTVTERSITEGQDPDNLNKPVMRKVIKDEDKMTFRVGRSKSLNVARWFTKRVLAQANTFNHDPEELNFAFFGSLTFLIFGNDMEGDAFTIPSVVFAQGSTKNNNNWWFGGETCRHKGDHQVRCRAIRKCNPSEGWQMDFRRGGGNPVSTVEITAFSRSSEYSEFTNSNVVIAADGSSDEAIFHT